MGKPLGWPEASCCRWSSLRPDRTSTIQQHGVRCRPKWWFELHLKEGERICTSKTSFPGVVGSVKGRGVSGPAWEEVVEVSSASILSEELFLLAFAVAVATIPLFPF